MPVVVVRVGDGGDELARSLAARGAAIILAGDGRLEAIGRLRAELAASGARVAVFAGDDDGAVRNLAVELFGEEPVVARPGASPDEVLGAG